MKDFGDLPKTLPVPSYLDEKVLDGASRFLARRRFRRRVGWSFCAAAAALAVISGVLFLPTRTEQIYDEKLLEMTDWTALDEEYYNFICDAEDYYQENGDMFL